MKKIAFVLVGNTLYALAVTLFVLPNQLITGGTTGLALVAGHLWGLPVASFVGIFNILMFFIGAAMLGKSFAITTCISTFYYPMALAWLQKNFGHIVLTQDRLLSVIMSGVLIGGAIGMVIRAGASTGGMDIPPLVLNKKFRIPISVSMYAFDCLILLAQMMFADKEQILYGLLLVMIYTVVLNKVLMIGGNMMQVKIISGEYEKISHAVQENLDRGTTLFEIEGGYTREGSYAILTVVSGRELYRLNELVMKMDPCAFMIINQVSEVRGRGFTLGKQYNKEQV